MAHFLLRKESPGCPQVAAGFVIVTRSQRSKITPLKFFYKVVGVNVNAGDADAELQEGERASLAPFSRLFCNSRNPAPFRQARLP